MLTEDSFRTKPGLHHLRKRDKPLRTYGRQTSTPEAQSEPLSKKARLSAPREEQQQRRDKSTPPDGVTKSNDNTTAAGASEAAHEQDTSAQNNKTDKTGESLKRGSILSYFKPALQIPKAAAPSQQPQDSPPEEEPAPSPQSSLKPKQPAKRKPRLLKIKATTIHEPSDQSSSSSSSQETDNHAPPKRRGRPPLKSTISNAPAVTPEATSSNKDTISSSSSSSPSPTEKPTTKPKKKPSPPSIQTTLNISAQAAFSECKICNTVWNPLYPDDVKYHTKTHKAVLRAEKKRKMDEL